jgi:hypothetical protein
MKITLKINLDTDDVPVSAPKRRRTNISPVSCSFNIFFKDIEGK